MTVFLGVDGGNTKTIALVAAEDGTILGAGRSECSDIYACPTPDAAVDEIESAVSAALSAAGKRREDIAAACFSLAGADWREDYDFLQARLEARHFGRIIEVFNDALGSLRAGTINGVGAVIACGTGAATAARNADGVFWHASFWQESLGGGELGTQALQAIYRAEIGLTPPTAMTAPVVAAMRQTSVEAVLHSFFTIGKPPPQGIEISRLAPIVLSVAAHGDGIACEIVEDHGRRLADYALVAARKVSLDDQPFKVVLNGGIFRHEGRVMVDAIRHRLEDTARHATVIKSQYEPVAGALFQAFERGGYALTPERLSRISATVPPRSFYATAY